MKYFIFKILTLLVLVALIPACSGKKEFLSTRGGTFVVGDQEILLRGFNFGAWMVQEPYMFNLPTAKIGQQKVFKDSIASLIGAERMQHFYDVWLDTFITKRDVDSIAGWGFNSIRLVLHYNLFTLSVNEEPDPSKQTWFTRGFELIDRMLGWCKANRIYLFLDLHAAPGGQGNTPSHCDGIGPSIYESRENAQRTVALWEKIAKRYVNEEWIGGYDLLNEPNYGFTDPENDPKGHQEKNNEPLREIQVEITHAIRSVDKNHLIIIAGNAFGGNYNAIFPIWDDNMAFCFHKYWNFNRPQSINQYLRIREEQSAPIWMSEAGENSSTWFTDCIALLEDHNISWSWWTYKRIGLPVPFEVVMCDGFKKVLDYWRDRAPRPSAEEAYAALMQLAEDHKTENTIYHPELIDAMTRQVKTTDTRPFKPYIVGKDGCMIHVVDFDMGRNEYAYYDKDVANYRGSDKEGKLPNVWNRGYKYRNDGVDIYEKSPQSQYQRSNDQRLLGEGYYVGYTEEGEWLQYTIIAEKEGNYSLKLIAAADVKGAIAVHFTVNGEEAGVKIDALPTGGQQQWQTFDAGTVSFKQGENRLRLYIDKNWVNLDKIELMIL